ncbi:hypothetical protein AVEN_89709-1 [Araneus ventricosus]|uniref:Uncharacterized protein n=1 Tax=Araneus ventricosus TaxID=182803 RepID=A0A4Y2S1H7_ARAVE|nr:hypothetical protein AVEN_89709-1 [Araneus ventricosus]
MQVYDQKRKKSELPALTGCFESISCVTHVSSFSSSFNRGEVANSPRALPYLDPRLNDLTPAPSFDVFDITSNLVRQPATPARAPAVSYIAPAVSRATIPANAAVPAFRYIPGHPYGTPVIYGYSSGAYTYYSPSVLSPYSYGSYGSYGSYHSEPYGYLYKK